LRTGNAAGTTVQKHCESGADSRKRNAPAVNAAKSSRKGLDRVVQATKNRDSNTSDHGPFGHTLPRGCRCGIVMLHLFFEACKHDFLLTTY
jgi:hypothetical protein